LPLGIIPGKTSNEVLIGNVLINACAESNPWQGKNKKNKNINKNTSDIST
jgi:hypothetical protein